MTLRELLEALNKIAQDNPKALNERVHMEGQHESHDIERVSYAPATRWIWGATVLERGV